MTLDPILPPLNCPGARMLTLTQFNSEMGVDFKLVLLLANLPPCSRPEEK